MYLVIETEFESLRKNTPDLWYQVNSVQKERDKDFSFQELLYFVDVIVHQSYVGQNNEKYKLVLRFTVSVIVIRTWYFCINISNDNENFYRFY